MFLAEVLAQWRPPAAQITGTGEVAIIVGSRQHRFPVAAGLAAFRGLVARVADEPFEVDGVSFDAGSLIVHRIRNIARRASHRSQPLTTPELSGGMGTFWHTLPRLAQGSLGRRREEGR